MRAFVLKLKPANGYSGIVHQALVSLLPVIVFVLVRLNFFQLALAIIVLSKWRMFAVKPRYWPANIRANGIDIIVGFSIVLFMTHSSTSLLQLMWALIYVAWLVAIKPITNVLGTSFQAMIGQLFGLMALFLEWPAAPLYGLVAGAGVICYASARHFFDSYDEPYSRLLSYTWAYFGAALTWLLGHWLLFYGLVAQPTLILTVIGYGLAVLYYFDHTDRLSKLMQRQFIFVMLAIIIIVLSLSNWSDKIT
ncbi:MAG TPA: hypothetical protein VMR18_01925 [Candidatus Saccharimonadales bacterium]|jgi:hypothetical protein|nr:hypothetical protein [Candidatus Saccharimonadales bacterium]